MYRRAPAAVVEVKPDIKPTPAEARVHRSALRYPKSCFRLRTIVETACAYLPPTMNKTSQKLQQTVVHQKRNAATVLHESTNRWFRSKPAKRGLKQGRGKMRSRRLQELRKNIIGPRVPPARLPSPPRPTQQK